MYIKTRDALVNLRDKDIVIQPGYKPRNKPQPYHVFAEGPATGFDSVNEAYIRTSIELFCGTEKDCHLCLSSLCGEMAGGKAVQIIDGHFEAVTGYKPDPLPEPEGEPQPNHELEDWLLDDDLDEISAFDLMQEKDEFKCENCKAPLTGSLLCAECGHDSIPF